MTLDPSTLQNSVTALLPNGGAWDKSSSSNLSRTVALFVGALKRIVGFIDYCVVDVFPPTTNESLSAWQASVGLPDTGYPGYSTLTTAQQKTQCLARIENLGGQSPSYYIQYAATLGYTILITELAVPRAGYARAGQSTAIAKGGDFVWQIRVLNGSTNRFTAGSRVGTRLAYNTDISLLLYEINRIKPAHTIITYSLG